MHLSVAHRPCQRVDRHWSPESEKYAGGDALVTLLIQGWEIKAPVVCETYWHGGARPTDIYHMHLVRDNQTMSLAVLVNPYIRRLVNDMPAPLRPRKKRIAAALPANHRLQSLRE